MKLLIRDLASTTRSQHATVLHMYGHHQTDTYSCGVAAAATILKAASVPYTTADLWQVLKPCRNTGVSAERMRSGLQRSYGIKCREVPLSMTTIKTSIGQGYPLLVAAHLNRQSDEEEHWMVVAGVRSKTKEVLLLNHTGVPGFTSVWWQFDHLLSECSDGSMLKVYAQCDVLLPCSKSTS